MLNKIYVPKSVPKKKKGKQTPAEAVSKALDIKEYITDLSDEELIVWLEKFLCEKTQANYQ